VGGGFCEYGKSSGGFCEWEEGSASGDNDKTTTQTGRVLRVRRKVQEGFASTEEGSASEQFGKQSIQMTSKQQTQTALLASKARETSTGSAKAARSGVKGVHREHQKPASRRKQPSQSESPLPLS
jgi:hypothetical protein